MIKQWVGGYYRTWWTVTDGGAHRRSFSVLDALVYTFCSSGLEPTDVAKKRTSSDPPVALSRKLRGLYSGSLVTARTKKIGRSIESKSQVFEIQDRREQESGQADGGQSGGRAPYQVRIYQSIRNRGGNGFDPFRNSYLLDPNEKSKSATERKILSPSNKCDLLQRACNNGKISVSSMVYNSAHPKLLRLHRRFPGENSGCSR